MIYDLIIVHPRLILVDGLTMLTGVATDEGYEKIYANPMRFARGIREICERSSRRLEVVDHEGDFYIEGFTCSARELSGIEKAAQWYAGMAEIHLGFRTRIISDQLFRPARLLACA